MRRAPGPGSRSGALRHSLTDVGASIQENVPPDELGEHVAGCAVRRNARKGVRQQQNDVEPLDSDAAATGAGPQSNSPKWVDLSPMTLKCEP